MKNILNYYYSLHPKEISHVGDKYFFSYNQKHFVFEIYKRPLEDIQFLYNVDEEMIKNNILVHKIIKNNENKILTFVNNKPYILMEIMINKNAKINMSEICYINNNSTEIKCNDLLSRSNWVNLWEAKVDFFESQINEVGSKYPNLCNYANYYIGLAENAISYIKEVSSVDDIMLFSICHKRLNSYDTFYDLYHPATFISDYRVRDISEYIKSCFFNSDNAYEKVIEYFNNNYISYKEALFFYGRLLYPSYFFDLYDDIVNRELDEKLIENIVVKSNLYEKFLSDIYVFLSSIYNRFIPQIDWIIKRSFT